MFLLISLSHVKKNKEEKTLWKFYIQLPWQQKLLKPQESLLESLKYVIFNSGQDSLHINFNIMTLFSLQYYKSNKLRFTTNVYWKSEHTT